MTLTVTLPDESATETFAAQVAAWAQAGDVIQLVGELGAGKSTFARAFIRAMGTQSTHIPSPTFTLLQPYEDTKIPVMHMDCYRLTDIGELDYLGLEDYWKTAVFLVEWPPEGLGHRASQAGTLRLELSPVGAGRSVQIIADGSWQKRLKEMDLLCR